MSLVIVRDLSLSFGPRVLLHGASFVVGPHDRIGVAGPNGSGKTTLLRLLAGRTAPDSGTIQVVRRARVGYLPQDLAEIPDGTVLESVLASVPGRTALDGRLGETRDALHAEADPEAQLELAGELADLQDALERFDERWGAHRAARILSGLGFRDADLSRPAATLSGGWRMRAALAALLLQDPELLLLDEPTNHLDVPTLDWFDDFLRRSRHALVLVSHDREFLDRQIGRVVSLEPEGLRTYAGTYTEYKERRALEEEQLEALAARQRRERAEAQEFIDRFRAKNTKARAVKSRERMLEKQEIVQVREHRSTVRFRFPPVGRPGREVLRFSGVSKRFGDAVLYEGLSLQVQRGERVAVVGANGAGKTTLLRLAAGELAPDGGEVTQGHGVRVGFFAQHLTAPLDRGGTVLQEVAAAAPLRPEVEIRGVLGAFLFSGDEGDKPLRVLSGGERARVALAKLLVVPTNVLLLDEPTNHLDLDSADALVDALEGYEGTLVFVSHNRTFANRLATRVWDVAGGRVEEHPGNLDDYLHHRHLLAAQEGSAAALQEGTDGATRAETEKERRRREAEARQARSVRERPVREEIARLETRIEQLEQAVRAADEALGDPAVYEDFARARPHVETARVGREELEKLYARWEECQRALEAMRAEE